MKKQKSLKMHILWILPLMLILSFQNCGKPKSGVQNSANGGGDFDRKAISSPYSLRLWDYPKNRYFDLDMDSGRLYQYNIIENTQGSEYCLSLTEHEQLKQILNGAEVCAPVNQISDDIVCTAEYRYPYASLIKIGSEVALGEMQNGCHNPTDLCGPKAGELQSFVVSTLLNLDTKTCD